MNVVEEEQRGYTFLNNSHPYCEIPFPLLRNKCT